MTKRRVMSGVSVVCIVIMAVLLVVGNKQAIPSASAADNHYQAVRNRLANRLTGNDYPDKQDEIYKQFIQVVDKEAGDVWKGARSQSGQGQVWSDLTLVTQRPDTVSSDAALTDGLSRAYRRVYQMALAYSVEGSQYYQNEMLKNDILAVMEWLYTNAYNERQDVKSLYGNWYDWQIEMPILLAQSTILMYDHLSPTYRQKLYETLANFNQVPQTAYWIDGREMEMSGANLMQRANIAVMQSVIGENGTAMPYVAEAIKSAFQVVSTGDGIYRDGSFIQHDNLAYTGGYGVDYLLSIEKILYALDDTPWKLNEDVVAGIGTWVLEGIQPLVVNGGFMSMVRGRGIARPHDTDVDSAILAMGSVSSLSHLVPEKQGDALESFAKQVLTEQVERYGWEKMCAKLPIFELQQAKRILSDESIQSKTKEASSKVFGAMDKVAHHTASYAAGLSLYSQRTGSYEYINGEGIGTWHISDGMLSVYLESDKTQFTDQYWPTVDLLRLPGVTTDNSERSSVANWSNTTQSTHVGTKAWVGGSTVGGLFSSAGMDFIRQNSDVSAKKSWFFFDDEIVALGANIQSTSGNLVETIVDNRMFRVENANVYANGVQQLESTDTRKVSGIHWAWLEVGKGGMGYYFPEPANLKLTRETRSGNWSAINRSPTKMPANAIRRSYVSLALEHGVRPTNESYAYVLLPNKSIQETYAYRTAPQVTILRNDSSVQAVQETKNGVIGINFWQPDVIANVLESKNAASVTMRLNENSISMGVSDPTQQNETTVLVVLGGQYRVESADSTVSSRSIANGLEITIRTAGSNGRSHNIELKKA